MREEADFSFSRERRLRKKKDFDIMFSSSVRVSADGVTLRYRKNGLAISRLGCMIGKKSGNAVERNRVRRICREVFRQFGLPDKFDLLVTLYRPLRDRTRKEIADILERLLLKVH